MATITNTPVVYPGYTTSAPSVPTTGGTLYTTQPNTAWTGGGSVNTVVTPPPVAVNTSPTSNWALQANSTSVPASSPASTVPPQAPPAFDLSLLTSREVTERTLATLPQGSPQWQAVKNHLVTFPPAPMGGVGNNPLPLSMTQPIGYPPVPMQGVGGAQPAASQPAHSNSRGGGNGNVLMPLLMVGAALLLGGGLGNASYSTSAKTIDKLKDDLAKTEEAQGNADALVAKVAADIIETETELQTANTELTAAETSVTAAQTALDAAQAKKNGGSAFVDAANKAAVTEAQTKLNDAKLKRDLAKDRVAEAEATLKNLKKTLTTLKNEVKEARGKVDGLKAEIKEIEAKRK